MQPTPLETIPVEVAAQAPDLYILAMGMLSTIGAVGTIVFSFLRHLSQGREASWAMAESCHATHRDVAENVKNTVVENNEALRQVANSIGESSAVIREATDTIRKNGADRSRTDALLERLHRVLDTNGVTRKKEDHP